MKQAFVSKGYGTVMVSSLETTHPYLQISLETGVNIIPQFSIKVPIEESGMDHERVAVLGIELLLEEFIGYLTGCGLDTEICEQLYVNILHILEDFSLEAGNENSTQYDSSNSMSLDDIINSDPMKNFEFNFKIPEDFYKQVYKKVVTAGTSVQRTERVKPFKREYLTDFKDVIPNNIDPAKTLKKYRNNIFKHTPSKNYVMVYDITGRPTGVMEAPKNPVKWRK